MSRINRVMSTVLIPNGKDYFEMTDSYKFTSNSYGYLNPSVYFGTPHPDREVVIICCIGTNTNGSWENTRIDDTIIPSLLVAQTSVVFPGGAVGIFKLHIPEGEYHSVFLKGTLRRHYVTVYSIPRRINVSSVSSARDSLLIDNTKNLPGVCAAISSVNLNNFSGFVPDISYDDSNDYYFTRVNPLTTLITGSAIASVLFNLN